MFAVHQMKAGVDSVESRDSQLVRSCHCGTCRLKVQPSSCKEGVAPSAASSVPSCRIQSAVRRDTHTAICTEVCVTGNGQTRLICVFGLVRTQIRHTFLLRTKSKHPCGKCFDLHVNL